MNSTIIVITNKHRKRRDINNRLLFKAHYFTLTLQFSYLLSVMQENNKLIYIRILTVKKREYVNRKLISTGLEHETD